MGSRLPPCRRASCPAAEPPSTGRVFRGAVAFICFLGVASILLAQPSRGHYKESALSIHRPRRQSRRRGCQCSGRSQYLLRWCGLGRNFQIDRRRDALGTYLRWTTCFIDRCSRCSRKRPQHSVGPAPESPSSAVTSQSVRAFISLSMRAKHGISKGSKRPGRISRMVIDPRNPDIVFCLRPRTCLRPPTRARRVSNRRRRQELDTSPQSR